MGFVQLQESALQELVSRSHLPESLVREALTRTIGEFTLLAATNPTAAWQLRRPARSALYRNLHQASRDYYQGWVKPLAGTLAHFKVEQIRERSISGVVSIGEAQVMAYLPGRWQVENEDYTLGQIIAVYVQEVYRVSGLPGVEILVSRTGRSLVRVLLEAIVPDFTRHFQIVGIERQPGAYTQVWLKSRQRQIEPGYLNEVSELLWGEQLQVFYD